MSADQPFFRFHPGAYGPDRHTFEASNDPCSVCGKPCIWLYACNLYVVPPDPVLCARCIANGGLETFMKGAPFSFHDATLKGADRELEEEVMLATPGFPTFNPFNWPVLDGKPLAFIGHGDEKAVWAIPEARAAISAAFGEPVDDPTPYALVFKEIDGERYVAEIDYD